MWQEVGVAALVGLALSDSWLCLFMGASLATADRRMSWGFLGGRTVGVVSLLLAIGLLGAYLLPEKEYLTLAFAVSSVLVAGVLAHSIVKPSLLGGCAPAPSEGDGDCPETEGCQEGCDGCSHGAGDEAQGDVPCPRFPKGLYDRLSGHSPIVAGFGLGAARGAMPCLKVIIITPLLVASPPATVVLMALAYALTSTVYPLIGLMSGRTLSTFLSQSTRLRLAGAIGVAAVGIITIVRFYPRTCLL